MMKADVEGFWISREFVGVMSARVSSTTASMPSFRGPVTAFFSRSGHCRQDLLCREKHENSRRRHDARRDPAKHDDGFAGGKDAHDGFPARKEDDDHDQRHRNEPVDDGAPKQSLHGVYWRILDQETCQYADSD